jgi:hypothetical protein
MGPKGKGRRTPGLVLGVRRVTPSLEPLPGAKGKRERQPPKSTSKARVRLPMDIRGAMLTVGQLRKPSVPTPTWSRSSSVEHGPMQIGGSPGAPDLSISD